MTPNSNSIGPQSQQVLPKLGLLSRPVASEWAWVKQGEGPGFPLGLS